MPRPPNTDSQNDIVRERIHDAVREMLPDLGAMEINMDKIARKAGLTKRTLYRYFNSKYELFLSLLCSSIKKHWQYRPEQVDASRTGYEQLYDFCDQYYRFMARNPDILRVILYNDYMGGNGKNVDPRIIQRYRELNRGGVEYLRKVIKLGMKDGTLRENIDVDMAISHLIYSLRAIMNRAGTNTYAIRKIGRKEYYYGYVDMVLSALANKDRHHRYALGQPCATAKEK